jgi:A/G-specific adenine glycosylase
MLQQTQVKTVIPFWERWLRELPTIEALAAAPSAQIHKLWEGLGYYTRVRNLQKAAQQIVAGPTRRRRGNESLTGKNNETPDVVSYKFPREFDSVLALPGIGRYTAGAICSIAFNQPTPILDGNVIRVLTRVFGIGENPREKNTNAQLWQLAADLVSHAPRTTHHAACSHLNQSLMELGALVCTPRNARCEICPVKKLCVAWRDGRVEALPNLGKRAVATERQFTAFVVERGRKFLVRQRPAGGVNAHLWEFPNVESPTRSEDFAVVASAEPLCVVRHSITRYRITLTAFRALATGKVSGEWRPLAQLEKLAFTAAHKKILAKL